MRDRGPRFPLVGDLPQTIHCDPRQDTRRHTTLSLALRGVSQLPAALWQISTSSFLHLCCHVYSKTPTSNHRCSEPVRPSLSSWTPPGLSSGFHTLDLCVLSI